jgi:glycosyltransferase involved in cell wall biosynthesis
MTEDLRVLMISGEYPPMEGGVADFTSIVGQRLADRGAVVHVLTSNAAAAASPDDQVPVVVHAEMDDWGFKTLYRRLRALVATVDPDIINIQYQTAAYGMHPAINLLPRFFPEVPIVVTFHDLRVPYLLPKAGMLRRWVNLDLARAADAVIVTNAQDRAELQQVTGIQRLETIPIGSNITYHLPEGYERAVWRGQWGVSQRDILLCFFGFLNDSKGAVELVQALKVLREGGMPASLMMIGGAVSSSNASNQSYYDLVKRTISELMLEDDVLWTGYVTNDEVSAAFKSSDVCVLPFADGASFRRGSLMAALTHGVSIVSTHPQVAIPEIVHRGNMMLVPPDSVDALVRAVREVVAEPGLRQRLETGAEQLSHLFDWDGIADRTLALYRQVLTTRWPNRGASRV